VNRSGPPLQVVSDVEALSSAKLDGAGDGVTG
jgi:hypothetical protein